MTTSSDEPGDQFDHRIFQPGDNVAVVQGEVWKGFDGMVVEVDTSLRLAIVDIPVFGRRTLVPFRFEEIAKEQ